METAITNREGARRHWLEVSASVVIEWSFTSLIHGLQTLM